MGSDPLSYFMWDAHFTLSIGQGCLVSRTWLKQEELPASPLACWLFRLATLESKDGGTMADVVSQPKPCRFCTWIGAFTYKMARILQISSPATCGHCWEDGQNFATLAEPIFKGWGFFFFFWSVCVELAVGFFLRRMQGLKYPLHPFKLRFS